MYADAPGGRLGGGGRIRNVEDMEITSTDLGLAARVQQLTKTFGAGEGAVHAHDGVSVGIRRRLFPAFRGPSGSGRWADAPRLGEELVRTGGSRESSHTCQKITDN